MYDAESKLEGGTGSPLCLSISASPRENESFAPPPTTSTYFSFPSPTSGRSPTLPTFRVPKYGYYNIEGGSPTTTSSPMDLSVTSSPRLSKKSSVLRAFIQSINFFMGIGVLALPYALRMTGWFGLVLLVLFGGVMTYTALLFGRNRRKFTLENFSDHIEFAFPTKGRVLVSFIFYSSLLLSSSLFLLLLANAMASCTDWSQSTALTAATVLYIVVANVCSSTSVTVLRWSSIVGTFAVILLMVLLLVAELLALWRVHGSLQQMQLHAPDGIPGDTYTADGKNVLYSYYTERVYWTDFMACLNTLGIFGYCYMGHEVFPSIFHNMKHPSRYVTVVYIAFTTMLTSYALIATLGYLAYGNHSAGNIMDNLPADDALTGAVKGCIMLACIAKMSLSTAPLSEGLLEWARLCGYLISHSSYLAHLVAQAPRRMPRLRLDPSTHSVTPSRSPSTRSTYGATAESPGWTGVLDTRGTDDTRRIDAFSPPECAGQRHKGETSSFFTSSSSRTTQNTLTPLQFELPPHRMKYFSARSPALKKRPPEHECGAAEESHLLIEKVGDLAGELKPALLHIPAPVLRPQPAYKSSMAQHHPQRSQHVHHPHGSAAHAGGTAVTPRRGLTWSDTIPIPPIRSPSCENIVLSGSPTGSHQNVPSGGHMPQPIHQQSHRGQVPSTLSAVPTVHTSAVDLDLGGELSSSSSSSSSDLSTLGDGGDRGYNPMDAGYDTEETQQTSRRLYEDFRESVDTRRLSIASEHSDVTTTHKLYQYFLDTILPVVVRTLLPVAAMGISLLFQDFVSMLVFIGGVYGGSVSIIIPAWAYYSIHYHEIPTKEKYVLSGVIAFGVLLTVATVVAFVL